MQTIVQSAAPSGKAVVTGRVLSGLAILFLLFDGAIKLVPIAAVTESMQQLGYSDSVELARGLGILTVACTLLYALPRTAIPGAILLTGLLGGAIATHLRAGSPVFSHLLFGVYLGALVWIGLYLRSERLRTLLSRS